MFKLDSRNTDLYLCRASLEFLKASGLQPHILQLHDWHAAAASMLYWQCYHNEGLWRPRIMLTIHNMDNTGECRCVHISLWISQVALPCAGNIHTYVD